MINGLDQNVKNPTCFLQHRIEIVRGAPHIGFSEKIGILNRPDPLPRSQGDWFIIFFSKFWIWWSIIYEITPPINVTWVSSDLLIFPRQIIFWNFLTILEFQNPNFFRKSEMGGSPWQASKTTIYCSHFQYNSFAKVKNCCAPIWIIGRPLRWYQSL